jgi:uncharacterized protein (TIGR03083 family)
MGSHMQHSDHVAALESAVGRFAALAAPVDLATPIPSCPGWSANELVVHLGDVHRWATGAIVEGRDVDREFAPHEDESPAAWYRQGAEDLLDVIDVTPPDREIWTFGPPPHRVAFWSRRQLHETVVHLWDLESATGEVSPIDAVVARDGIDEVCGMFYPRQVRLDRMAELEHTIGLDDGTGSWLLGPAATPDVTVRGRAPDLLLLLWKRVALDAGGLVVDGDVAVLLEALGRRITP